MFTISDGRMVSGNDDAFVFIPAEDIFNHCINISREFCIALSFTIGLVKGVQKPLGIEDDQYGAFAERNLKRAWAAILGQKFQVFLAERVDEPGLVLDPHQPFPAAFMPVVVPRYKDALRAKSCNPS